MSTLSTRRGTTDLYIQQRELDITQKLDVERVVSSHYCRDVEAFTKQCDDPDIKNPGVGAQANVFGFWSNEHRG